MLIARINAQKAAALRKKIQAAFEANPAEPVADLAARLGCSRGTVHRHRHALGLYAPRRQRVKEPKPRKKARASKAEPIPKPEASIQRKPKAVADGGIDPLRHWILHSKAEIVRHLASKKLPKGQLGGGNCDRCKYKPEPGTPFEKSPCKACPYIGLPPGSDKEARQEGHGRVSSLDAIEAFVAGAHDPHAEDAIAHNDDNPAERESGGDFYATIDAHLEADARRTAESFGGVPMHTPPLESQRTFGPPPILEKAMEEPAENFPPKKSNFGGVTQEALGTFAEALASISQLSPTQIVAVFRRMAGAEHHETAKELGVTASAVSAAISRAAEKVPILGAAIQINTAKRSAAPCSDSESGAIAARVEAGKRHPAYAQVLEMLASGELGGKVGAMLARCPLSKGGMEAEVSGMLGVPKRELVVESVIALIVENGLCHVVTNGRGLFYCTYPQARDLRAGGKREVGPDIKGAAYPDGRPVPMLWREGVASLGAMDSACALDLREKLYELRAWMSGTWMPVEGFPGLEYAPWRGRGGAVWFFRRGDRQGAVLTWHDDGEPVRGSVLDRRLRIWRGKPAALVKLAKTKMRGWFD